MVAFSLVTIDPVLALGGSRGRDVAIDHVAIRLLWGARENLESGLHLLTRDSLFLPQEVLKGVGDTRQERGVLLLEDPRGGY